jgi:hypothetical protein
MAKMQVRLDRRSDVAEALAVDLQILHDALDRICQRVPNFIPLRTPEEALSFLIGRRAAVGATGALGELNC